jgi:predicted outer membrane repeat protein
MEVIMKKLYFFLISLCAISYSHATIFNVPADKPTIQAGINAAVNGDTVLVQPGIYIENINYNGKNITIASLFLVTQDTSYISQTIIYGDGTACKSVVFFVNGEDSTAILTGFTLTNGYNYRGGGINCIGASPSLSYLTISNNHTHYWNGYSREGGGIYCENSCLSLRNVKIISNSALPSCPDAGLDSGGGISCKNSDITMQDVSIMYNTAESGGGIYCNNSSPVMNHIVISSNTSYPDSNPLWGVYFDSYGGGMSCVNGSNPVLHEVTIDGNTAYSGFDTPSWFSYSYAFGGGIYCASSSPEFIDVIISNNISTCLYPLYSQDDYGGGIYCSGCSPSFQDVLIANNSVTGCGGGMYCDHSFPILMNATITENIAGSDGGGMYCASSAPVFDSIVRANIYFNMAFRGNDLYSDTMVHVTVDTFTVLNPSEYHAEPFENFVFDILHGKREQVDSDLYVSPYGDNNNAGVTPQYPLKNIRHAFSIIRADSLYQNTIRLMQGTYSASSNQEIFPFNVPDYIRICGVSADSVTLDAEMQSDVLFIGDNTANQITGMTISGGREKGISIVNSGPEMSGVFLTNNQNGMYFDNSSPALDSIIIFNNAGYGLNCANDSNPYITNCEIKANVSCGVQCESNSNPVMINSTIMNNTGGGLRCHHSCPFLENVIIANNSTDQGAGIYCEQSNPVLENVVIMNNTASTDGGGLFCVLSSPAMDSVIISGNSASAGGGMYCSQNSAPHLKAVSIKENSALEGGGFYCSSSIPSFDEINRCNIYLNNASWGNDLFSDTLLEVVVDTFTVLTPMQFHAHPLANFSFDILHGKMEQVNADLYVSPSGENTNSGLTADDPLKTIHCALSKILTDSLNPHILHLLNGTYSPSSTGEYFPVVMGNYLSLSGESEEGVVLDGVVQGTVIYMDNNIETYLTSMTITGGSGNGVYIAESTAGLQNVTISGNSNGIYCKNSSPLLEYLTLSNNNGWGSCGIHCDDDSCPVLHEVEISNNSFHGILCTNNSNPILENVQIFGNGQGGMHCSHSSPTLLNVVISGNSAEGFGGGMRCEDNSCPYLENVLITGNHVWQNLEDEAFGGGFYSSSNSSPTLVNVEISDNQALGNGGGMYFLDSNPVILNVNIIQNTADKGGGIFFNNSDPLICNSTLADNVASIHGGAIFAGGGSAVQLLNSILWNNTVEQIALVGIYGGQNTAAISYSDVQGGEEAIFLSGTSTVNWLEGNIDLDPQFTGTGDYPFALSDNSPCINAGNPDTTGLNLPEFDLAGNPRFRGGRIDMGSYENQNVSTFITQHLPGEDYYFFCTPNPFTDITTITYELTHPEKAGIKIFNQTGQLIKEFNQGKVRNETNKVIWQADGLPPGIYYIRLQYGIISLNSKAIKLN